MREKGKSDSRGRSEDGYGCAIEAWNIAPILNGFNEEDEREIQFPSAEFARPEAEQFPIQLRAAVVDGPHKADAGAG